MGKTLILVAAPPACGKNYVSEMICRAVPGVVYLDKDDLSPLLGCSFAFSGQSMDVDGAFYTEKVRPYEYETFMRLAFSALRFSDAVLLNAPFLREVRDENYMRQLKERAAAAGAKLLLIWVTAPLALCYERMRSRNSPRDILKLQDWDAYVQRTNYSAPVELRELGAVDHLLIVENENEQTAHASLDEVLKIMEGRQC